jgi:O-antigen/teichoic acid export membrane protein
MMGSGVMNLRNVAKNTGALTVANLLNRTMAFLVSIPLAVYLGEEMLGLYAQAYAFVNIFSYFNELGLSQLMVQDASRDKSKLPLYFGNALLVKVTAIVVVFLIMLLCMVLMGYSGTLCVMIIILGLGMGFNNFNQTVYNYYQTKEKMSVAAGFQFLESLLIALMTLGVIFVTRQGVVAVTAAHLISFGLLTILLLLALRKQIRPVVDVSRIPQMIAKGIPFGLQRAVNNIFPNVTILLLSLLLVAKADIGIFRAAQNLVVPLVFLPNAFAQSIYPILFRLGANDKIGHQKAMEKVFKILAAVGIPASFFLWMLSSEIIHLLYRGKFEASAAVFAALCWYFAFECLCYPLGDVMMTMNRRWQRTIIQGSGLVLLVALTLWAQARYGLMGSVWAILLVEVFLFLSYYIYIRLKMYPIRIWRQLPSVLAASACMMGTAYLVKSWNPVLVACTAAAVYSVVIFVIDNDMRFLLKRVLKRSSES